MTEKRRTLIVALCITVAAAVGAALWASDQRKSNEAQTACATIRRAAAGQQFGDRPSEEFFAAVRSALPALQSAAANSPRRAVAASNAEHVLSGQQGAATALVVDCGG